MDFKILTIEEALQQPPEAIVSIAVCVLKSGDVKTYKNKLNEERRYYTFQVADSTNHVLIRSYLMKKQTCFAPGTSLMLQGLIRKTGEEPLWAVSSTKVVDWAPVEVPANVQVGANKPQKRVGDVRPLAEAIISNTPSTVIGKILQRSPLKHRRQGELPTKFVRLQDCVDGPHIKLALFGEDALREYQPGDVLSITDAYRWKTTSTLSTKKSSKIEFLPPDSVPVNIEDQPVLSDDPDFEDDTSVSAEPQEFTVMGVQSAYAYQCCPNAGCRNKKLDNGACPSCKVQSVTQQKYYTSAVIVIVRDGNCSCVKIFQDELEKLFQMPNITSDCDLKTVMLTQLPINAKGVFGNSGLKVTSHKRKFCD